MRRKNCVDDVCVTRDQFAEVSGNQSAAAGGGALSASPTPEATSADTATTTTPATIMKPLSSRTRKRRSEPEEATVDTLLVDTALHGS